MQRPAPQRFGSGCFKIDVGRQKRWVKAQPWREVLPDPFSFEVEVRDIEERVQTALQASLLPHEVFGTVWKHARPVCRHATSLAPVLLTTESPHPSFDVKCMPKQMPAGVLNG